MRILQVIHDFLPRHAAGSELYCFHLSRELAKHHDVHVFYAERDPARPQYETRRVTFRGIEATEVVHNHLYRRFEDTYADPVMDRVFSRVLDDVRPDVVHLHHLLHHSIGYIRIARRRGLPVAFTLHDYWLSCPNGGQRIRPDLQVCETVETRHCADCIRKYDGAPLLASRMASTVAGWRARRRAPEPAAGSASASLLGGAPHRALLRLLSAGGSRRRIARVERRLESIRAACREVDLFLAPSAFLAARLREFGLPAERVLVSANGLRGDLAPLPRRSAAVLRFGYIGTLAPHKGLHVLMEAFRRLSSRHPGGATLSVYGSARWYPDYVARLRARAADGVTFHGEFAHDEVARIFAGLDVLVVPSVWWENAPLTIQEAMAIGTPVLAANFGGMAEMVQDGTNGLLFAVGDAVDLARRMESLLVDRSRLDALRDRGGAARTIEADAAELERRFRSLLEGAGRAVA